MKTKFIILILFLFTGFTSIGLHAQESAVVTGGDNTGTGGSVSYSVGQVSPLFMKASEGSISQGVQQPYEIFVVTATDEADGVTLDFQVYPNPAQDFLQLKILGLKPENLVWNMYDLSGKLLGSDHVSGTETQVSLTDCLSGVYLFVVTDKNNFQYKTFKIIKN